MRTSQNPGSVPAVPPVRRPPPSMSEPGLNFPGKFQSVLGKSKEVGEYLKGHTESSATLAKEAVLVNETNKV